MRERQPLWAANPCDRRNRRMGNFPGQSASTDLMYRRSEYGGRRTVSVQADGEGSTAASFSGWTRCAPIADRFALPPVWPLREWFRQAPP
jgi:hypothetical protein